MWQLFQFPLCPFSRKVRLMLGEKGVAHELVRESPWLKRDEFIDMNPAGQTPVLVEDAKGTVLIDSNAICEYFEETIDRAPMIPGTAVNRAEVRRLRSEEHTSELQSLMRISYAVFCLKKKKKTK